MTATVPGFRGWLLFLALLQVFTMGAICAAQGPSGLVSDDFNTCQLNPSRWAFVDPVGDGSYILEGANTDAAHVAISVPAGVNHDAWTDGAFVPRIVQAVADTDFEVEVKFDSAVTGKYQLQGLLIEESAGHFMRFNVHSTGTQTRLFAATIAGGSASIHLNKNISPGQPITLRVLRTAHTWTLSYSSDGASFTTVKVFTHAMVVTSIGPFAGNYHATGAAPAHTAIVDYVFNTDFPIIPEDGAIGAAGETFALDVTILDNGTVLKDPDLPGYHCGDVVTLTAVPDPGSEFVGWSGDASGADNPVTVTMTRPVAVTATFYTDVTPPVLGDLRVEAGVTRAYIAWTTDEPATSTLAYGLTPAHELGSLPGGVLSTAHRVQLDGLSPGTIHHFEITAADENGNTVLGGDLTLITGPAGDPELIAFASDDFNLFNLDPMWTFIDPRGDAGLSVVGANSGDARLILSLPFGLSHDVWTEGNFGPRVMQDALDIDFEVEALFDGVLSEKYQMHGILAEQDSANFLRFDFHSNGTQTRIFAVAFVDGLPQVQVNDVIANGNPIHMRVTRVGDSWTQAYSYDGVTWSSVVTFSHSLVVSSIGPFIGNAGTGTTNSPAHSCAIDYFFETTDPFVPEDGDLVTDTLPPLIYHLDHQAAETSIQVSWSTEEESHGTLHYGLTPGHELGSVSDGVFGRDHTILLTGLTPYTIYNFQAEAADASGNAALSENRSATTEDQVISDGPTITLFHGSHQVFGALGVPQQWANILGNVYSPFGVTSLTYTLNGGPQIPLSVGADTRRLASDGDFNIELDFASLLHGLNTLVLTGHDALGKVTVRPMVVEYQAGNVWPLPYSVDWNTVTDITAVSQVVDGEWEIAGGALRPTVLGYDRLVDIGDISWTDYEVLVPITIHGIDASGYAPPSNGPALGILMRWPGHVSWGNHQPRIGYYPMGALGMYRWRTDHNGNRLEILGNNGSLVASDNSGRTLANDVPYYFKMKVTTIPGIGGLYQFKVWEVGQAEPTAWDLEAQESLGDPQNGSFLLLAHHVDASFGTVTVTPGNFVDNDPPVISNVQALPGNSSATVSWATNEPASGSVSYGLTPAHELGSTGDATLLTARSITLPGLDPDTQYHYEITATDGNGNVAVSGDLTFITSAGGGGGMTPVTSDDFSSAALNAQVWSVVDPLGDGSFTMTGSGTGDALLEIGVPAGTNHDVWSGGNDAPRVMQTFNGGDFEVEIKFESPVAQKYQMQGIIVEQDAGNYIRFDFYSTGTQTRAFAASFSGGVPAVRKNRKIAGGSPFPLYMRVKREGNLWTQSWSLDGASWSTNTTFSFPLTASAIGPYAGNFHSTGNAPAFTSQIDYLFNTASPIVPEDGGAP